MTDIFHTNLFSVFESKLILNGVARCRCFPQRATPDSKERNKKVAVSVSRPMDYWMVFSQKNINL
jgi:hypothetical protein